MGISSAQKQKLVDAGYFVTLDLESKRYDWQNGGNGCSATGYETRSEAWAACWAFAATAGMQQAAKDVYVEVVPPKLQVEVERAELNKVILKVGDRMLYLDAWTLAALGDADILAWVLTNRSRLLQYAMNK